MDTTTEGLEPQKTQEDEPTSTNGDEQTSETGEELTPEQIADLKHKAEVSSQNFERAKKLETDLKEAQKKLKDLSEDKKPDDNLSTKDTIALVNAKVSVEDFDEVVRVAKILGKPISEALNDKTLKSILNERNEERRTAQATHTSGGAPSSKVSGETLLTKARRGEVPEKDEDIEKLAEAEMALRKKKL